MRLVPILLFTITAPLTMANFFSPSPLNAPAVGPQMAPWQPQSKFETFGGGLDVPSFSPTEAFDLEKTSIAFLSAHYSIDPSCLLYKNGYEDDITKHAFVSEAVNGIPFINAEAHVVFTRFNKVSSVSSTLVRLSQASITSSAATISEETAIAAAESELQGKYNQHPIRKEYMALQNGSATLVFIIQIQNDSKGTWYEGYVDASTGKLVAATNFVAS